MALEGSLKDFDLFSLFNMIKIQGKTGTLVLSQRQEFIKVFFENGEIVGCDSNQVRMEDRVGTMLVRLGRLSGEELLATVQMQRQTLKRMGTLLIETGRVRPSDLQDALFSQACAIILRSFRWVEGDYRFDSVLPDDLDREHFVPIPVDTILMEAARIQDEWPEVERKLPGFDLPLGKSVKGKALHLDIDRDLSSVLEGQGNNPVGSSGLTHEQEIVLSYFETPQSIHEVIQVSRYEELDTCKAIAELLGMGLLEAMSPGVAVKVTRPWVEEAPPVAAQHRQPWEGRNGLLWPVAVLLVAMGALLPWTAKERGSMNVGLSSFQAQDRLVADDGATATRVEWAYRLASPKDGGRALAESLGRTFKGDNPVEDLTKLPDPLGAEMAKPAGPEPEPPHFAPAEAAKPEPAKP